VTAEEYIERYGAQLSDADKRYIMAFGPPAGFHEGSALNPSTPNLRVANAPQHVRQATQARIWTHE